MDLHSLEYFVAVAEEGSFTRGAERSHVVQSAASAAVARLERELGADLFDRVGRRIEITEAGRLLLDRARVMLGCAQAARDDIDALGRGLTGVVTVGTVLTTGRLSVAAALAEFHRRFPQVKVRFRLSAAPVFDHLHRLQDGSFDILIAPRPPHLPVGVRMDPVGAAALVLTCRPDDPLATATQVRLADLAGRTFVDFPVEWGNRMIVDAMFKDDDVHRVVAFEVVDVATALGLVLSGTAIGFVPDEFVTGRVDLATVELAKSHVPVELGVAVADDRPLTSATAVLAEILAAASQTPR